MPTLFASIVETLNNGNGMLLSPPHNNSGHHQHQQQQHQQQPQQSTRGNGGSSSASAATVGGGGVATTGGNERNVSSVSGSVAAATSGGENNIQITQPISAPSSPLASPGAISPSSFCLPTGSAMGTSNGSGSYVCPNGVSSSSMSYANLGASNSNDTADPNWQATKATVLERNAAMFNNELMSDVRFVVGGDFGKCFY